MIIEIKENTFKSNNFKGLNYLIQILTYKQRYELFVELAIVRYTGNYQKLDFDDQKVIEDSYNKIVQEGTTPKYFVSESNVDGNVFCIEEAIRFFNQPVSVILENSLNDQRFLCAIIKHFDSAREVQRHLDNGWIQFENAGGCTNVINFIQVAMLHLQHPETMKMRFCHIILVYLHLHFFVVPYFRTRKITLI